jgi:hypothetical protein
MGFHRDLPYPGEGSTFQGIAPASVSLPRYEQPAFGGVGERGPGTALTVEHRQWSRLPELLCPPRLTYASVDYYSSSACSTPATQGTSYMGEMPPSPVVHMSPFPTTKTILQHFDTLAVHGLASDGIVHSILLHYDPK